MGNCCRQFRLPGSKHNKKIVLLLVGLDNAGKTTVAKSLLGEDSSTVVPTVGFSSVNIKYKRHTVTMYDLGGGEQIRAIWSKYFSDVHGIIFVMDSSDLSRLEECQKVFRDLISHTNISQKPLLFLANKQDCEGALDELDIVEKLGIEHCVNQYKCPTLIETCRSNTDFRKPDVAIENGFRWLIDHILHNFTKLNERVLEDMAQQQALHEIEKKERALRIQKNQQERGHVNAADEDNIQEIDILSNPFKPLPAIISNMDNIHGVNSRNIPVSNQPKIILVEESKQIKSGSDNKLDDKPHILSNDSCKQPEKQESCDGMSSKEVPSEDSIKTFIVEDIKPITQSFNSENPLIGRNINEWHFSRSNKTAPLPLDKISLSPLKSKYASNKCDTDLQNIPKNSELFSASSAGVTARSPNFLLNKPARLDDRRISSGNNQVLNNISSIKDQNSTLSLPTI